DVASAFAARGGRVGAGAAVLTVAVVGPRALEAAAPIVGAERVGGHHGLDFGKGLTAEASRAPGRAGDGVETRHRVAGGERDRGGAPALASRRVRLALQLARGVVRDVRERGAAVPAVADVERALQDHAGALEDNRAAVAARAAGGREVARAACGAGDGRVAALASVAA